MRNTKKGLARTEHGSNAKRSENSPLVRPLQDSVGVVLESVVEFGGQRVYARIDHGVDEQLELLLRQIHVETVFQGLRRGSPSAETRELTACTGSN